MRVATVNSFATELNYTRVGEHIVGYHPPFFPHNELVHLPYLAVATNTREDYKLNFFRLFFV